MSDLRETISMLIRHADPSGANHKRLEKLLKNVNEHVFLGPKSLKFISGLVALMDNIECAHMNRGGFCLYFRKQCPYVTKWWLCPAFERPRTNLKRGESPIGVLK